MAPKLTSQSKTLNFGHVFTRENAGKIDDFYSLGKQSLGEGSFGQVCVGEHKSTKQKRAIKAISIGKISDKARFEDEVNIQQELDHPNIVKLFEVFKDAKRVYLVMELCTGGELFDRIVEEAEKKDGQAFSENEAATYMKQIMRAIHYLHSWNYAHRDIKPENFLLQHKGRDAEIKVIDFGLAKKFKPGSGEFMKTKAGTPYYVAPQVLQGKYDEKCDIWSCGVIMYILLCGYPPFYGDEDQDILRSVRKGKFDFPRPDWDNSSKESKNLITIMLTFDPVKRPDAAAVLAHSWFECQISSSKLSIQSDFAGRLKSFRSVAKLKKVALTLIATQMDSEELKELKATFEAMDDNHDGTLTVHEITEGLKKHKCEVPEDLKQTLEKLDTDGSGSIDYTEFLAATLNRQQYNKKEVLWTAFRVFDRNGDGMITQDELKQVMASTSVSADVAKRMIAEVDQNGDGQLSFEEFVSMMEAETGPE